MPRKRAAKKETYISLYNDFYSDITKEGMLYAALLRSPSAGKISNIIVPDLPEDFVFFTAKDIPGKNEIVTNNTATPIFADGFANYAGEPLGIIAGPSLRQIQSFISEIEIQLDESATLSVLDNFTQPIPKLKNEGNIEEIAEIERALDLTVPIDEEKKETIQTDENNHTEKKVTNKIVAKRFITTETTEAKNSDDNKDLIEVSTTTRLKLPQPNWLETSGAYCAIKDKNITIYTHTKNPVALRASAAIALGIQEEQIYIKKTKDSTQNADGLWRTATIAIQVALVACKTEKPVKLVLSRNEQMRYIPTHANTTITNYSRVKKDGGIHSMNVNIDVDVGAWNPFAQILLDRLVIASCNIYNIQNVTIDAKAYTTDTPPTSLPTHMIDSQVFFAIENHFSKIATELNNLSTETNRPLAEMNFLPTEIRLVNCMDKSPTSLPFKIKAHDTNEILTQLINKSVFNRKYVSFQKEMRYRRTENRAFQAIPLRGIGVANTFAGSDYFHPFFSHTESKVEMTLEEDGTVIINSLTPIPEIKSTWASTIEKTFGSQKGKIKFEHPEINYESTSPLELSNGSIGILSELFERSCAELQRKVAQKKPLPLTSKKNFFASVKKQWNSEKLEGVPFYSTSFAAAVVEVQVDTYTYRVTIKGIWLVIDCGKVISQQAAERTTKLAIQQELSNLIVDETIKCDSISISFIQSSDHSSAIGDLIHNTLPAAFCAALSQALGKDITSLPYSYFFNRQESK